MVVLEVYSRCLTIRYKAWLCSKATLFSILTAALAIIVPFIFVYNIRGFWFKHDTFYEQPTVNFRGEYFFIAITNNLSLPIMCNNFPNFQAFAAFDRCSLIKVRETDKNYDGKIDEFYLSIKIEIEDMKLLSFYLVLPLDYSLNTVCAMQMQSAMVVQYTFTNLITSSLNIHGNLGLAQLEPLYCYSHRINHKYNYSCIENQFDTGSYDIKRIITTYLKRNVRTHLINQYTTFNTGSLDSQFIINLKVHYSEHKLYYIPGFWQVIKWAWIQYVAVYIIFAWILRKIRSYVFENKLLLFYEASPLKKNT